MESLRVAILKLCTKEWEVNNPLDSNSVFSLLGVCANKTHWILGYVGLELFWTWQL
jgi:predicted nucleic acid-binding protein